MNCLRICIFFCGWYYISNINTRCTILYIIYILTFEPDLTVFRMKFGLGVKDRTFQSIVYIKHNKKKPTTHTHVRKHDNTTCMYMCNIYIASHRENHFYFSIIILCLECLRSINPSGFQTFTLLVFDTQNIVNDFGKHFILYIYIEMYALRNT